MIRRISPSGSKLVRGLLCAATSLTLLGQAPDNRYRALLYALGLSDSQLRRSEFDEAQRTRLAEIGKTLDRWRLASFATTVGLIRAQQWPGQPLCYYPARAFTSELGLSDAQVSQLERLQQAAQEPFFAQIREKESRRVELLHSGSSADSPVVVKLLSELSGLQQQLADVKPRRELVLALLDDAQKAQLAAFENAWEVENEAIELELIPRPPKGELLCP